MLESELNVGIKKLINNQESLSEMDDKASKMKSTSLYNIGYANEFHQNSEKLERMLYWRNMKIKIFIGLCVLGLIGFAVLIVIQVTGNNNGGDNKSDTNNSTRLLTRYS